MQLARSSLESISGPQPSASWLLVLFALTTAKVFLFDVWQLSTVIRTFAFVALGASLLLVSFLYRRYRDRIRAWITTTTVLLAVSLSPLGPIRLAQPISRRPPSTTIHQLSFRWPIENSARPAAGSGVSLRARGHLSG